jgi:hypothetical protein
VVLPVVIRAVPPSGDDVQNDKSWRKDLVGTGGDDFSFLGVEFGFYEAENVSFGFVHMYACTHMSENLRIHG